MTPSTSVDRAMRSLHDALVSIVKDRETIEPHHCKYLYAMSVEMSRLAMQVEAEQQKKTAPTA